MSGHSKWKNIMHKKGAADARRGKIFSKLIKELSVAVKTGGGPDPDANPRLRAAVQNARAQNMPKDTVERAIKKAAGVGGDDFQEIAYEAFGPNGVAFFIDCATDNKVRTIGNIRSYFNKYGGNMGKDGCLQFLFLRKGIFTIENLEMDEDQFTLEMIDAGAEDVQNEDGILTVTTAMDDFGSVQKKLQDLNITPQESGLQRICTETKKLDEEAFMKFMKLLEVLEDDDDVQKVYHNVEFDEELLNKMG
ncbi:MAG: transcriptional regulator [Bdellovibrionales bacterium RIFOXYA1_FULL_36_14]|nr:MAG: transcriptional regulator [Bdellovibrionales bacterium RIFOXYA1_FULL_36_14]